MKKASELILLCGAVAALAGCWQPPIDANLDRVGDFPKRYQPVVLAAAEWAERAELKSVRGELAQTRTARVFATPKDTAIHAKDEQWLDHVILMRPGAPGLAVKCLGNRQAAARPAAPLLVQAETVLEQAPAASENGEAAKVVAETPLAIVRLVALSADSPVYYRKRHDEIISVLAGEGIWEINGIRDRVRQGTLIVVPRGARQRFIHTRGTTLVLLSIVLPNDGAVDRHQVKRKK